MSDLSEGAKIAQALFSSNDETVTDGLYAIARNIKNANQSNVMSDGTYNHNIPDALILISEAIQRLANVIENKDFNGSSTNDLLPY